MTDVLEPMQMGEDSDDVSPLLRQRERPLGDFTVVVKDLSVTYEVRSSVWDQPPKNQFERLARRLGQSAKVLVRAVDGVSFAARAGEMIGVIGANGSGKSTLLRAMAGLESPEAGVVLASSPPSFLGVGAVLQPDLSGIANARLGLLAQGMTPAEVEAAMPDVIELAGIGKSINLPMRTYSSGMGARLRFAISAAARPQILLIDEGLATGDAATKERSERRMAQILDEAGTVFLVSHAPKTVENTCTRAIWLHQGRIVLDGPTTEVSRFYRLWAAATARGEPEIAEKYLRIAGRTGEPPAVELLGAGPASTRLNKSAPKLED